jgi:hypothetical protein
MFDPKHAPLWFAREFGNHDIECYSSERQYSQDTVFYYDMYGDYQELLPRHLEEGFRIIYDAKNEHYLPGKESHRLIKKFQQHPGQVMCIISGQTALHIPGVKIVATPYWYWYTDQLNWRNQKLDTWQPQRNPQYTYFMQISLPRSDRDMLYDMLAGKHLLEHSLHSYRGRNIFLPGDIDPSTYTGSWQRYINKDWYQNTWFSLTVETYINDNYHKGFSLTQDDNLFFSEKTYKAFACQHPFVLASTYHNLSYVRAQGFETFSELFDEDYDHEPMFELRMNKVCDAVKSFRQHEYHNPQVQEKIRHNHDRFFNRALTHKFIQETVVFPVLDFLYAQT